MTKKLEDIITGGAKHYFDTHDKMTGQLKEHPGRWPVYYDKGIEIGLSSINQLHNKCESARDYILNLEAQLEHKNTEIQLLGRAQANIVDAVQKDPKKYNATLGECCLKLFYEYTKKLEAELEAVKAREVRLVAYSLRRFAKAGDAEDYAKQYIREFDKEEHEK